MVFRKKETRGKQAMRSLSERNAMIHGISPYPQPQPVNRDGSFDLQSQVNNLAKLAAENGIKSQPDKKLTRKLGHTPILHKILGGAAIVAGVVLSSEHNVDVMSLDQKAGICIAIGATATATSGLKRAYNRTSVRDVIIESYRPYLQTEAARRMPGSWAAFHGVLDASSVALDGAGAALLGSAAFGGDLVGVEDPKVKVIAGSIALGVGFLHHFVEGAVNRNLYESAIAQARTAVTTPRFM